MYAGYKKAHKLSLKQTKIKLLEAKLEEAQEAEYRLSTIMIVRIALRKKVKALCIALEAMAASVGAVASGSTRSVVS